MLYAWIDGIKRPPFAKGESTICRDCGGPLTSVMPVENVPHWRHKAGDCDPWSEPEGPWHLAWKEAFPESNREIGLVDQVTGEHHRADVLCNAGTAHAAVLELQYSPISEEERVAREAFYRQGHRMYWLVHVHDGPSSFTGWNFKASMNWGARPVEIDGRRYAIMQWMGRSKQFIEKWKRATGYVFLECENHIFFLAGEGLARRMTGGIPLKKGEYALSQWNREDLIRSVQWTGGA
ncbi:hypothetical protein [Sphingorhabdus sp.]|uniref:competence protein CoiA n=1 Tax=Sphingorhabdus sp. TaxID=1902408 RepID=UPI0032B72933